MSLFFPTDALHVSTDGQGTLGASLVNGLVLLHLLDEVENVVDRRTCVAFHLAEGKHLFQLFGGDLGRRMSSGDGNEQAAVVADRIVEFEGVLVGNHLVFRAVQDDDGTVNVADALLARQSAAHEIHVVAESCVKQTGARVFRNVSQRGKRRHQNESSARPLRGNVSGDGTAEALAPHVDGLRIDALHQVILGGQAVLADVLLSGVAARSTEPSVIEEHEVELVPVTEVYDVLAVGYIAGISVAEKHRRLVRVVREVPSAHSVPGVCMALGLRITSLFSKTEVDASVFLYLCLGVAISEEDILSVGYKAYTPLRPQHKRPRHKRPQDRTRDLNTRGLNTR